MKLALISAILITVAPAVLPFRFSNKPPVLRPLTPSYGGYAAQPVASAVLPLRYTNNPPVLRPLTPSYSGYAAQPVTSTVLPLPYIKKAPVLRPLKPSYGGYAAQPRKYIAILRSENHINPDGSYQYGYETDNGISAQVSGRLIGSGPDAAVAAYGSYQYTAPDGTLVQVSYVADQNGFRPVVVYSAPPRPPTSTPPPPPTPPPTRYTTTPRPTTTTPPPTTTTRYTTTPPTTTTRYTTTTLPPSSTYPRPSARGTINPGH